MWFEGETRTKWCKASCALRESREKLMLTSRWMALEMLDINYTSSHPILARAYAKL